MTSSSSNHTEQFYNLKWSNHSKSFLNQLSEHLLNENFTDVTLFCEGQCVKAHKLVLSCCSKYFGDIFRIHGKDHPIVIMTGIPFTTLKQMIEFMYQGQVKVAEKDLDKLFFIAESLQISGLCRIRKEDEKEKPELQTPNTNTINADGLEIFKEKNRKRKLQSDSTNLISRDFPNNSQNCNGNNSHDVSAPLPQKIKLTMNPEGNKSITIEPLNTKTENEADKIVEETKARRPSSAFMIFADEWRNKLSVENPDESKKEISVRLGNMWKAMSKTTKEQYYAAFKKDSEGGGQSNPCKPHVEKRKHQKNTGSNIPEKKHIKTNSDPLETFDLNVVVKTENEDL